MEGTIMREHLNTEEAAKFLNTTTGTLYVWRSLNRGPFSYKIGKRVYYPVDELQKWVESRRRETARGGVSPAQS